MKKILLCILLLGIQLYASAQANLFNYQGVARTATGAPLANKNLSIKITLIEGSATGTTVYQETHSNTTNEYGMYHLLIGNGTPVVGEIANIPWGTGNYYMQVEMDPNGGTSYVDLGTQQLVSVPFAKMASGINIYQSGTANPQKVVIAHSPQYQDWGLVYHDNNDEFSFISSNIPVFNINLSTNKIQYPHSSKGNGNVLTSDIDGNAAWEDKRTKFSSITIPGCPSLASVNTTMTKIIDLGTFTKVKDATFIQLDLATHFFILTLAAGATGAVFELRINNTKTTLGNASYLLKTANSSQQGTITGVFPNLSAGNYTVSIWVRTSYNTGTSAMIDNGCWNNFGANSLIVKEFE
jgi:hypothetical protein